jgi:hypothetical protein
MRRLGDQMATKIDPEGTAKVLAQVASDAGAHGRLSIAEWKAVAEILAAQGWTLGKIG